MRGHGVVEEVAVSLGCGAQTLGQGHRDLEREACPSAVRLRKERLVADASSTSIRHGSGIFWKSSAAAARATRVERK